MELQTFIADSAPEAVSQIRGKLGPEAVVVNVRKMPVAGLARLWQKPKIEVLAFRPETAAAEAPNLPAALTELRQELFSLKQTVESRAALPSPSAVTAEKTPVPGPSSGALTLPTAAASPWRIRPVLESTGLLPIHAQRVSELLIARQRGTIPENLGQEIHLVSQLLMEIWRARKNQRDSKAHVFVGAPGVGKTTCLCQWLARMALLQGEPSRVWRLDGRAANHAELLSVYAEILGVPVERLEPSQAPPETEWLFIDLPGVNWTERNAVLELGNQISRLPKAQVHLVLNAAYGTELLFSQIRAFAGLPMSDLIFTHLDEEPQWGKLWNFVLGTNYTIACLSAGQNVPGDFQLAGPEQILARQFPRK